VDADNENNYKFTAALPDWKHLLRSKAVFITLALIILLTSPLAVYYLPLLTALAAAVVIGLLIVSLIKIAIFRNQCDKIPISSETKKTLDESTSPSEKKTASPVKKGIKDSLIEAFFKMFSKIPPPVLAMIEIGICLGFIGIGIAAIIFPPMGIPLLVSITYIATGVLMAGTLTVNRTVSKYYGLPNSESKMDEIILEVPQEKSPEELQTIVLEVPQEKSPEELRTMLLDTIQEITQKPVEASWKTLVQEIPEQELREILQETSKEELQTVMLEMISDGSLLLSPDASATHTHSADIKGDHTATTIHDTESTGSPDIDAPADLDVDVESGKTDHNP